MLFLRSRTERTFPQPRPASSLDGSVLNALASASQPDAASTQLQSKVFFVSSAAANLEREMTEQQIKHMVDRFLGWKLPENFTPDAGISFKKTFNDHTAHPMKHEPSGTNLFDATQADALYELEAAAEAADEDQMEDA